MCMNALVFVVTKPFCCFIVSLEGSQPEREAGRDGDLQRYPVQAGGHASEIL